MYLRVLKASGVYIVRYVIYKHFIYVDVSTNSLYLNDFDKLKIRILINQLN